MADINNQLWHFFTLGPGNNVKILHTRSPNSHCQLIESTWDKFYLACRCSCESCWVMSYSLRSHGLYSPWNSPGQNTGVGSLSLLQGIFSTQESKPGLLHCRWILYQLSHKGSPRIPEWVAWPSSVDLPDPGIKPASPALQVDSLPTEPWENPKHCVDTAISSVSSIRPALNKSQAVLFFFSCFNIF